MSKPTGAGRSRSKRSRRRSADPGGSERSGVPPWAARGIRIGILGFDGVTALDLVGPADAFAIANEVWQALYGGPAPYRITLLGLSGRKFVAESGLSFEAHTPLDDAPSLDTLIVPGGSGLREPDANARLVAWLQGHARSCRRIASVCTGIYGLAPSGLLDGRRVTTHWRFAHDVARRFPKLVLDDNALFLRDGPYYTSAGITAGIDLSLALIEEDLGPRVALAVARDLVVYLKRPGGQAQYSEPLRMQVLASDRFADLVAWMVGHLDQDLSVEALAARANLSPRHFSRRFNAVFGCAPARYVEDLRMSEARRMLSQDRVGIQRVAAAVGFASTDVFRRAFERRFGLTPLEYRERFRVPDPSPSRGG
jgi:transcriptional regulator GlxA family with amidase domain